MDESATSATDRADAESLRTVDGRHVLRMRRRLSHRPEKVWRAITEPEQIKKWFPAEMRLDAVAGAAVSFSFGGDGVVTVAEAPRVFEYTWDETILRWELAPDGDGCLLTFIHTFDDRPGAASFAAGWDACIAGLDAVVAGREPPPASRMVPEHEGFIHRFGLDRGSVESTGAGWRIRFERQLTAPAEPAWATAFGDDGPTPGGSVPTGFVAVDGTVTAAVAPKLLEFDTAGGHVRWELTDGTGHGARLVVTHTGGDGDPRAVHDRWRERIEALATRLAADT